MQQDLFMARKPQFLSRYPLFDSLVQGVGDVMRLERRSLPEYSLLWKNGYNVSGVTGYAVIWLAEQIGLGLGPQAKDWKVLATEYQESRDSDPQTGVDRVAVTFTDEIKAAVTVIGNAMKLCPKETWARVGLLRKGGTYNQPLVVFCSLRFFLKAKS